MASAVEKCKKAARNEENYGNEENHGLDLRIWNELIFYVQYVE